MTPREPFRAHLKFISLIHFVAYKYVYFYYGNKQPILLSVGWSAKVRVKLKVSS